jgi:hypothetical protein
MSEPFTRIDDAGITKKTQKFPHNFRLAMPILAVQVFRHLHDLRSRSATLAGNDFLLSPQRTNGVHHRCFSCAEANRDDDQERDKYEIQSKDPQTKVDLILEVAQPLFRQQPAYRRCDDKRNENKSTELFAEDPKYLRHGASQYFADADVLRFSNSHEGRKSIKTHRADQ